MRIVIAVRMIIRIQPVVIVVEVERRRMNNSRNIHFRIHWLVPVPALGTILDAEAMVGCESFLVSFSCFDCK
jgi:hypothetical protein